MALNAFPDTHFVVATHADDVTGRVGEREDSPVVSLNAVETGTREQIPDAKHPVLRPGPSAKGFDGVDESGGDWATVAVQGVHG